MSDKPTMSTCKNSEQYYKELSEWQAEKINDLKRKLDSATSCGIDGFQEEVMKFKIQSLQEQLAKENNALKAEGIREMVCCYIPEGSTNAFVDSIRINAADILEYADKLEQEGKNE